MRRFLVIGAGWLAATAVATAVAVGAVGLVGRGVTDRPQLTVLAGAELPGVVETTSSTAPMGSSTSSAPTSTLPTSSTAPATQGSTSPTTTPRSSTSTAVSGSSTTTVPPTSVPSTTVPSSSTVPTTTQPAATGPFAYAAAGGSVTIACIGDTIRFDGAVPTVGYSAEVKDAGPGRVRVEFSTESREDEIRVECVGGLPQPEIREG